MEPEPAQKYLSIIMLPTLFRILIGVMVDSRAIFKERKYLVMGSHFCMCVCYLAIILGGAATEKSLTFWAVLYGFFNEFIMASLASYAI